MARANLCDFDTAIASIKCFKCLPERDLVAIVAYISWIAWQQNDQDAPTTLDELRNMLGPFERLTEKQLLSIIALTLCGLVGDTPN